MAENERFEPVRPFFQKQMNPVNICFAVNEQYALPLRNVIYSLVKYANDARYYDILVMTKGLSDEAMTKIGRVIENHDNVSIRFIDMSIYEKEYLAGVIPIQHYLSVETDYRLFLATDMFAEYERMIYLDCDTLVQGNIAELFDTDLEGKVLGAVPEYSFRYKEYQQNPMFVENEYYSIRGYCTKLIGLQTLEDYFNAGVLLFDLTLFRRLTTIEDMMNDLTQKHFLMNDQDVLNHLIKGDFKRLDVEWNYLNIYEFFREGNNKELKEKFGDVYRDEPKLIHYVGHKKPWMDGQVPLKALYDRNAKEIEGL